MLTLGPPVRIRGAGLQPGTVIRVAGKGLLMFKGSGHGDLYVRIRVRVPETLSSEERELYEPLRTRSARRSKQDGGPP